MIWNERKFVIGLAVLAFTLISYLGHAQKMHNHPFKDLLDAQWKNVKPVVPIRPGCPS